MLIELHGGPRDGDQIEMCSSNQSRFLIPKIPGLVDWGVSPQSQLPYGTYTRRSETWVDIKARAGRLVPFDWQGWSDD